MAIIPSEFVRAYAPWSTSKADVARQCPQKFYLQYVKKVKTDFGMGAEARIGKAVHTAMEYALQGVRIEQCFKIAADMHGLVSTELDSVNDFMPAARKFMTQFTAYRTRNNALPPEIELKLGVDLDGNPVKFFDNEKCFLRGVVDVAVRFVAKPAVLIIDHKTGAERGLEHFTNQFNAYQLLLRAQYPTLETAHIGLNYLAVDKMVLCPTEFCIKDIGPLMDNVVQFLNDATVNTANFEQTCCGPLCNWCEYKKSHDCPAYQVGNEQKK